MVFERRFRLASTIHSTCQLITASNFIYHAIILHAMYMIIANRYMYDFACEKDYGKFLPEIKRLLTWFLKKSI
jgi:hypothetical protein